MRGLFFRSVRVGQGGGLFWCYKIRTLKGNGQLSFAGADQYLPLGRFLRRLRLDELPQLWNVLCGECVLVGPRPMEPREAALLPKDIRERLLSVKPGLTSLAALAFFDEERVLQKTTDPARVYWQGVKPIKIALDCYWIEHRSFALMAYVLWATAWRLLTALITRR